MIADAKIKTDKVNARILAELLRGDLLPASYAAEGAAGAPALGTASDRAGTTSRRAQDPDKDRTEAEENQVSRGGELLHGEGQGGVERLA
jgi:hypothetical protein